MRKVVVYSKENCYPCKMAKKLLEDSGVHFEEIMVSEDADGEQIIDLLREKGHRGFPVILVDGVWENSFNGFRPDLIAGIKN